jgi:hypothetical protein
MMKRSTVVAMGAWLVSTLALAEIHNIDNAELLRLQEKGVPVVDIRTPEEWRDTGVIKGARLMTYSFSGGFDKAAWLKQVQRSLNRASR